METGTTWDKFLESELTGRTPLFSEPLIVNSVSGATNDAFKNYDSIAPICSLISWVNIDIPAGTGAFTIVDNLGRVMFNMTGNVNASGHYPLNWYVRGSVLKLTCSDPNVLFSVGHQYVTVRDAKK